MSSNSINVSTSNTNAGSLLQITGLASGLDTNSIITALMAIDRQPETQLKNQQQSLQAQKTQLTSIQSALQNLALNVSALDDPGLWANTQTVTSSDATRVSASMTSSAGAGVGGYQVSVTQLANSSQKTFTYSSPTSDETITIHGDGDGGTGAAHGQYDYSMTIKAGESASDFVNAINADSNAPVYATQTASGQVILSERQSGAAGAQYIQIQGDTQTALTQVSARAGQNASYSVDGSGALTSRSNTITDAIAGVTLNLNAVTTVSGPITVNVGAPGPNSASVQAAVKTFVDSYNSIVDQINTQLTQKTDTSNPTVGSLFGDSELTDLLGSMRQAIYTAMPGLSGVTSLADIGVTTGAASGSATFSQDSVDGKLTIDSTALANAIQSNPNGVKQMLQSWSNSFAQLVNNEAQPGGTLDSRIQGDTAQYNDISDQISNLESILADRQTALQSQFADLEATLSQNQAQSSWLTSQINSLPGWSS
ncbi:MAG TPA: flagellar filament capping protein FliD [Solirubrobacteraceae bacterium]|nr:flagellar filament capping protein FliD [Solirubrobacteraceae bacterium]